MRILHNGKHLLNSGGPLTLAQAAEALDLDSMEGITLVPENPSEIKSGIQDEVAKRYGVKGDPVSAALSIAGKVGDATSLSVDAMVHDIIATEETKTTAYSKARIRLFKELHDDGDNDSWAGAVAFANQWHQGRVEGEISMPFDDKGIAEVITESADLGGFVRALIAQMNSAANG